MNEIDAMGNALNGTLDYATASAHSAVDKTSEAAHPAVDHLVDSLQHAAARLGEAANQAAVMLETKGEQLTKAQSQLAKRCRTYVQEQPLTTIGIAVASGVLLGWALRQR